VAWFAAPANFDMVMVDGRVLRRAGKCTAADEREIVGAARDGAARKGAVAGVRGQVGRNKRCEASALRRREGGRRSALR
jgi:hypothetical protein